MSTGGSAGVISRVIQSSKVAAGRSISLNRAVKNAEMYEGIKPVYSAQST